MQATTVPISRHSSSLSSLVSLSHTILLSPPLRVHRCLYCLYLTTSLNGVSKVAHVLSAMHYTVDKLKVYYSLPTVHRTREFRSHYTHLSLFLFLSLVRYSTYSISDKPKYASSPENMMHSVLIHEYYSRFDQNAVFVTVDTTLRSTRLDIKAYVRSKVGLPGKTGGVIFTPIPCEVVYFEPEKVGVNLLQSSLKSGGTLTPVLTNFEQVER